MNDEYILLPMVREISYGDGVYEAGWVGPVVVVDASAVEHEQGYELTVSAAEVKIVAHDEAGAFYGRQTFKQIRRQGGGALRQLRIEDWPDFAPRGVMLDISRDKVPTMETLCGLVDMLSEWKVNQLQLYMEHTFAYRNHREVWAGASPMTGAEMAELDAYCRERFVELVPCQNLFGHMVRWFKHERYRPLAETPDGFPSHRGWHDGGLSLSPVEPGSMELVRELFGELVGCCSSGQFNVCCDETEDIGHGKSAELCKEKGKGRVYLEFLLKIYELTQEHGKVMQFWGDIILEHPELIKELPTDNIVALEWGYEAGHRFDERCEKFAEAKVPFYVCPGTSTWSTIGGRTDNAMGNLWNAAENGLKHGAIGYLNTDWGDHGHWQKLAVCYLGYAYGAAVSWAGEANRGIDIARALDVHAFEDEAGVVGQVAYELGNAYKVPGVDIFNRSVLFNLLIEPERCLSEKPYDGLTVEGLERTIVFIHEATAALGKAKMKRVDAEQIVDELNFTAELLRFSCRFGIARLKVKDGEAGSIAEGRREELAVELEGIINEYKRLWLVRNREGGLVDSVGRMESILNTLRALGDS